MNPAFGTTRLAATGRSVPQLLNAAYLVDDGQRAEFVRAVGELAREAHRSAVEVTV
ncbi:hypothetical protein ACFWJ5_36505 [Streptomyces qaidamensis]|uniref:hypothetical protein n=1 Tax=Streptomyces qaidamensis TaxID=1783515 RepID=UPI00364DAC81